MKEQPHYTGLLTEEFFTEHYVEKRMSFPALEKMLRGQGHNIARGTIYKYCKKLGIQIRDRSEARKEWEEETLNYNVSYLTNLLLEVLDGYLLGDGCISVDNRTATKVARLQCGVEHEEFCTYMMSFFKVYQSSTRRVNHKKMKQGFLWNGRTKHHPDLYQQYVRWYSYRDGKYNKTVPIDVRITPLSTQIWYLGDGSIVQPEDKSTAMLRLSTDGFTKDGTEYLVKKLREKGILCHRNNENRIQVEARGIPAFFKFIGTKSPVSCYDYKFDLPLWRLESKRMREVAEELEIDYNRLSYFVKIGKIDTYRLSPKGRPRFLPKHIEKARELIKIGELY